ncbi:MAG: iron chelate uptake ABC transporter family permease subunit [Methanocellales archaeon]|nr:iron chelate uptake ABC transporter family permease subunit [Methanocellales archaeon]MDD3292025.1 iron chelate uptake ABC transporter family permease subunit [Methanocellales archaeon]MDD5235692.1 iron chelate uptake ABC transporter family permease subunit [Methanocellales archaeon]MDD5485618.1 iron chelate uptake ABC transporter family permease subunit [Methanocellales archaeon]
MEKSDVDVIHSKKHLRWSLTILCLVIGVILTVLIALIIGPINIPMTTVFKILLHFPPSWPDSYRVIIMDVRLPRILLGALVGSALAVAGCAMQGLFKNPMASPYILGISSGAAFGASLAIVLGSSLGRGIFTIPVMAFIFAIVTIFLVYNIAKSRGRAPIETLLLAGIAVGAFFTAQVSLMKYIAGEELRSIVFWLMGGFWASSWDKAAVAFPSIILGVAIMMLFGRDLNVMLMGEDHAVDLGINVEYVKKIILIFSSLVTAAAVSVSGIIGFVGLIIPHIMRLIVGPDHRILLPSSCLVGAMFLIGTDTLARTIIQPTEIPVGIITASFGAPFFLYLLRQRKRVTGW